MGLFKKIKCIHGNIHELYSVYDVIEPYDCRGMCLKPDSEFKEVLDEVIEDSAENLENLGNE